MHVKGFNFCIEVHKAHVGKVNKSSWGQKLVDNLDSRGVRLLIEF